MSSVNGSGSAKWFSGGQPNPAARLRLFCFPYAGLGTSAFRGWSGALGPDVDVCPVQLPGRESRQAEPPFTRIEPLADAAAAALAPHLDVPFALLGHSMGGLIAFELARRLDAAPRHLFVSARRAPHLPERLPPIAHLPNGQFVEAVQRRYAGIPAAVAESPDLLELLLPRLRADFEVLETYAYAASDPVACPISVFGGLEDATVTASDLDAWRAHTSGRLRTRMLPGPHLFLQGQRDAMLAAVAEDLGLGCGADSRVAV
jgi:surfactin synthase thioesterase subunit